MSDFNKRKDIRTEIHKNGLFNHFSKNYKNIFFPILFLKFEQYFFFVQYCSKNEPTGRPHGRPLSLKKKFK